MKSLNFVEELGIGLTRLSHIIDAQELTITEYKLKAAMYKAYFFGKTKLAETLQNQIRENYDACVGEFDGMCYASWRAKAVYRTLEDMVEQGLISKSDYSFCEV